MARLVMILLGVARTGIGGQRTLRQVKGVSFCFAVVPILVGHLLPRNAGSVRQAANG